MIWWVVSGVLSYVSVPLLLPIFKSEVRKNYLGEDVPTALGLAFVLTGGLVIVARLRIDPYAPHFSALLLFVAVLGIIDDLCGEATRKGFRGHLTGGRLSTGTLKAWGGVLVSTAIASSISSSVWQTLLNGIIIALMANFVNLLDLRPGRAAKFFLILGGLVYLLKPRALGPLFGMLWAVAGFLPWDLRRVAMMGDAGSNPLGAVLGLACVLSLPLYGRIVLASALILVNALSEKVSFSRVIESNRFLRFIDQLGR